MHLNLIYQDIFVLTLGAATFLSRSPEMQELLLWRVLQSSLCLGTDTDGSDVSGDKQKMCTTWEIVSKLTLCVRASQDKKCGTIPRDWLVSAATLTLAAGNMTSAEAEEWNDSCQQTFMKYESAY